MGNWKQVLFVLTLYLVVTFDSTVRGHHRHKPYSDSSSQDLISCKSVLAHLQSAPTPSIESLLEKIRDGVYKKGVRTTEFFRDFDKLRSGVITEKQVKLGHLGSKKAAVYIKG